MTRSFLTPEELKETFEIFINNRTGITAHAFELPKISGHVDIPVYSSDLSRIPDVHDHISLNKKTSGISGAGSSSRRDIAETKAYCEALERYCNVIYNKNNVIVATQEELGDEAIPLSLFASGAPEEYTFSHYKNYFRPADPTQPMRWVQGYSLLSGTLKYVPLITVFLGSPYEYPAEGFYSPISTGSAIAASYEQAIISGICEVVERDVIQITWLQELPLPRIDTQDIDDPDFWDRLERSERNGIEHYFYNGTFDLGIPTVYSLHINRKSRVAALVMASTKLDPVKALIRVMDEAAASRLAVSSWSHEPNQFDPKDFHTFERLEDGAIYFANHERLDAFDFLLKSPNTCHHSSIENLETGDVNANLAGIVQRIQANNLETIVVDTTPPTIKEVGMYGVKVVMPELVPLGLNYNMRFLGAKRLYSIPAKMGYPVKSIDQLNVNPQPFA